ncbi:hypothetical protein HMPREF1214_04911 [Bacteroides sp. HPS0048]|uniref:hypothetical protein n=1 Tax=Bacteroides sp. HPS0048 TaxID=1078089 RepID=UPI00036E6D83|nr:hypothetical protein [Bacteroides sp. HPS0048]EOA51986.1 hypothetical protein HMPREF1214_04911 [Bacteroides sp. HPS0048]
MDIHSTIKERLIRLCEELDISPNQFSQEIGKNRDFIRKITGEIGSDALRNIYRIYPNINILWLITGEGQIFLSSEELSSSNDNLISYLKEENKELKQEIKLLIKENATLSAQLELYTSSVNKDAI